MFPTLARPLPFSPRRALLLRLARRIGPFLLALALAALVLGCIPPRSQAGRSAPSSAPAPRYRAVLPAEGISSLKVGIPLGAREIRTGRISVVLEWSTAASECAILLSPRVACREGHGRPTTEGEEAGLLIPGDDSHLLQASAPPGGILLKPYLLELRRDAHHGSGEVLTLEFVRDPSASEDTCGADLSIVAVRFDTGTKMAREAMHVMRDDRSRPVFGSSNVRTATIKPR